LFSLIFISFNSAWFNVSFSSSENDTHAIMNDIVYINHMKIADVAILDMQMSKVPIISGYDESRKRRVVMRLVHATDKTWYTVLYHHTMYVISLSNISIKTNFKQIARVELKCVQYSEGDYILCMTSRYFFRSFTIVRLLCFVSHSNSMTSCQRSSGENVSCNVAPFFYHHSVVIQYLVSDRRLR
jgi:hypothetical protein